jgi:hypothetical protein
MNNTQITFIETENGLEAIGGLGVTIRKATNGRYNVWRGTDCYTATTLDKAKRLAVNLSSIENIIP